MSHWLAYGIHEYSNRCANNQEALLFSWGLHYRLNVLAIISIVFLLSGMPTGSHKKRGTTGRLTRDGELPPHTVRNYLLGFRRISGVNILVQKTRIPPFSRRLESLYCKSWLWNRSAVKCIKHMYASASVGCRCADETSPTVGHCIYGCWAWLGIKYSHISLPFVFDGDHLGLLLHNFTDIARLDSC